MAGGEGSGASSWAAAAPFGTWVAQRWAHLLAFVVIVQIWWWWLRERNCRLRRQAAQSMRGRVVLITGGGMGLGRELAVQFARLRSRVVLWDLYRDNMEVTASMAMKNGAQDVRCYCVDVADRAQVQEAANLLEKTVGEVDVLVNNAGLVYGGSLIEADDRHIERTIQTNLLANFWTVRAFLPSMARRNTGLVVTVSSVAGMQGVSHLASYTCSKFASFGFSDCLRHEIHALGCHGVRTLAVFPYLIDTGMFNGVTEPWAAMFITGKALRAPVVAQRIVEAALSGTEVLVMPPQLCLLPLMRMLPTSWMDGLNRFIGAATAMRTFKGRGPDFGL